MDENAGRVRIDAPGKINLFLRIAGRRDDGYHELDSLMQSIGLSDRLEFTAAPERARDELACNHPQLAIDGSNLILRACAWVRARLSAAGAPPPPPLAIYLEKHIPIGAGLGGGSADAAATLRALARHWKLDWPTAVWLEGALALGSDVPFCHRGGQCRCRGRGELLENSNAARPPAVALLCPPQPAPTAAVYAAYARGLRETASPAVDLTAEAFAALPWQDWGRNWRNDLTAAACAVVPQLTAVRNWFARVRLKGGMSGSGTTFVAACASLAEAAEVGACFEREFPHGRSFAVEPVTAGAEATVATLA
ncbi:MAG: 4-(cytidine 5'-diphospho)-2-C-methyl-D-erythritol kinase [Planctomycetota bacterium]